MNWYCMGLQVNKEFTIVIGTILIYYNNNLYLIWFDSGYSMILIKDNNVWIGTTHQQWQK